MWQLKEGKQMNKYKKKTRLSIDERIENSNFNYCKNLKWFLIAPIAICIVGIILLCTLGFNLGLDFTGGSTMKIYTNSEGVYQQYEQYDLEKDLGAIETKVNEVLKEYGLTVTTIQKTTMSDTALHISDGSAVVIKYQNDNSMSSDEIEETNDLIKEDLLQAFGYTSEEVEGLVKNDGVTTASASSELMMKSFIALLVAVVLILAYIAIRFEFTSGLAAILALFHDLLITASVVLICRIQINVAFIAALITILGYSINNTIIIFDKMRDELKSFNNTNMKIDNQKIANKAVKNMMTRSILTTLTTFISIFMITVIGVADIREFAFPIMIGIVAGFYSSVFLTPGLWAIGYKPKKGKRVISTQEKEIEIVEE